MKLVRCEGKYWEFIRQLRNNPDVKGGFISQKEISRYEHANHMISYGHGYFVCLSERTDGQERKPLGYCGVINNDIRVAVLPESQGKGVGKFMINELMKLHPDAFAKVKLENDASISLFEACGFKKKYFILERG